MAYEDDRGFTLLIIPYAIFMVIFHVLLHNLIRQDMTLGRSLSTSSDSVCKFMSCGFIRSVFDFVYHQYGILPYVSLFTSPTAKDVT